MNASRISSDSIERLAKLAEIKNQEIQRNHELIELSKSKLSNLKIARMEIKYFVACSFDCLSRTMPQLSSQNKPIPAVIDFNEAKIHHILDNQKKKLAHSHSADLDNSLSYLNSPGL